MTCASSTYRGHQHSNRLWQNYIGSSNYVVPLYFEPTNLSDLVWILQRAERENRRVKAVGRGWSYEDIAVSQDWVVDLSHLAGTNAPWPHDRAFRGVRSTSLKFFHAMGGIRLHALNRELDSRGLAMPTLGGSQGQTLAGAISTGTHGGDFKQAPLPDLVQAIHLVTTGGREMWIESASSPLTNQDAELRAALRLCPDAQIVRDDSLFNAVLVGMGRFGVIHSFVLRVSDAFRLREVAEFKSWREVSAKLALGIGRDPADRPFRELTDRDLHYFAIILNPRNAEGCWVLTRERSHLPSTPPPEDGGGNPLCDRGVANTILVAAAAALRAYAIFITITIPGPGAIKAIMIEVRAAALTAMSIDPHITGGAALAAVVNAIAELQLVDEFKGLITELNDKILSKTFSTSLTGKVGSSWEITARADDPTEDACRKANSVEIIFSTSSRAYIDFINNLLGEGENYLQAGYISVRFSRRSQATLSMHHVSSPMAVAIEVTSLQGLDDSERWMRFVEDLGKRMGGRPHWGQQNNLTRAEIERLYGVDVVNDWRRALHRVVGTSVTFSNNYTRSRGLEPLAPIVTPAGTNLLDLYWSDVRGDNLTTATEVGRRDASAAGYRHVRTEGYIYTERRRNTVPLDLYWSDVRGDNFTTATEAGRNAALTAGYRHVRTEGYIFAEGGASRIPLKLYWNAARGDNFVTASDMGIRDAEVAGYRFVRIEGYILPPITVAAMSDGGG